MRVLGRAPRCPGVQRVWKRPSCLTCRAKSSGPWKNELAELNAAIRKSCDDEEVWAEADEVVNETESLNLIADQERVFLVGVQLKSDRPESDTFTVDESLSELASLSRTAGLAVVGSAFQVLPNPNPSTYLGSGKLASVATQVRELAVDTVIIDDEISPGQQRNLEKALGEGVRVADRTALILDIFAQRARTKEGKLQVDLAAADYQLPRLQRMWTHLDRQSGGGQVKGMGEKQMEVDKRLLRDKMAQLRKEIEAVRAHRSSQRKRRRLARMPSVALIGYTNAGKSTLLNSLTAAGVLAENSLFATLDPTVRRIVLPSGKQALLSDTVGFIQKLPTQLVDSFRATLEEIKEADVLVHVVDVAHPQASKQAEAVFRILEELKVSEELPMVTAWNKVDAHVDPDVVRRVANTRPDTVAVSGSTGEGVEDLLVTVEAALEEAMVQFEALVPYTEGHIINQVREEGVVRLEKYTEDGVQIAASADLATVAVIQPHITEFSPRERLFEWRQEQAVYDQ